MKLMLEDVMRVHADVWKLCDGRIGGDSVGWVSDGFIGDDGAILTMDSLLNAGFMDYETCEWFINASRITELALIKTFLSARDES